MTYEIEITNVPDGAFTEWYSGADTREFSNKREALKLRAAFRRELRQHPQNFEPEMEMLIHAFDKHGKFVEDL